MFTARRKVGKVGLGGNVRKPQASSKEVQAAVKVEGNVSSVEGGGVAFRRDAVHGLIVAEVDHGAMAQGWNVVVGEVGGAAKARPSAGMIKCLCCRRAAS